MAYKYATHSIECIGCKKDIMFRRDSTRRAIQILKCQFCGYLTPTQEWGVKQLK